MRRPGHALITNPGRRLPSGFAAIAGIVVLLGVFLLVVFGFHRSAGTASTESDLTGSGDAAWQTNSGPMMSFAPTTSAAVPTRDGARKDPLSFTDSNSGTRAGSAASRSASASRTRAASSPSTRAKATEVEETAEHRASSSSDRTTSRTTSAKTSSPAHKPTPKRIPAQTRDADTGGGLGGAVKALVPAL